MSKFAIIVVIAVKIYKGLKFVKELAEALIRSFRLGNKLRKIARNKNLTMREKIEQAIDVVKEAMPKLAKEWEEAVEAYTDIG